MKSATRSDRANRPKFRTVLTEHTCRAFRGIYPCFLVSRVDMCRLMRMCALRRGKLHPCNARQRCSAKLEYIWCTATVCRQRNFVLTFTAPLENAKTPQPGPTLT